MDNITLHKATVWDIGFLRRLHNEGLPNFIQRKKPGMLKHIIWSLRNINKQRIHIAWRNGERVGAIRCQHSYLSYSVLSYHRRKGYAGQMLKAYMRIVKDGPLLAIIRNSNIPSIKTAESCGFKRVYDDGITCMYIA